MWLKWVAACLWLDPSYLDEIFGYIEDFCCIDPEKVVPALLVTVSPPGETSARSMHLQSLFNEGWCIERDYVVPVEESTFERKRLPDGSLMICKTCQGREKCTACMVLTQCSMTGRQTCLVLSKVDNEALRKFER